MQQGRLMETSQETSRLWLFFKRTVIGVLGKVVPCCNRANLLHATWQLLSWGIILLCTLGTDCKANVQQATRYWTKGDEMLWGQKDSAVIRNTWVLGSARVNETTYVLPATYIWNIIWIKRLSSSEEIRAFCTFSVTLLLASLAVCKSGSICALHWEWLCNRVL